MNYLEIGKVFAIITTLLTPYLILKYKWFDEEDEMLEYFHTWWDGNNNIDNYTILGGIIVIIVTSVILGVLIGLVYPILFPLGILYLILKYFRNKKFK